MQPPILLSWIGSKDLEGIKPDSESPGPIIAAIEERGYSHLRLLSNYPKYDTHEFIQELKNRYPRIQIDLTPVELSSPTAYGEIYPCIETFLEKTTKDFPDRQLIVHLSPGTPAMTSVWILLTKTRFPVAYIETYFNRETEEQHFYDVELPFEVTAEFLEQAKKRSSNRITQLAQSTPTEDSVFQNIFGTSPSMLLAKERALRLAELDVSVLLQGESGTGKELFARAIHNAGSRKDAPFIPVNCGAIPSELIESTLFGHIKGAFTGADKDVKGRFREAHGGTLFLDEIGELPLEAQVRLLRVLQDHKVQPVGSSDEIEVDVRIIAATHRNLLEMTTDQSFRLDLFYRIAVGILELPALRERTGEIPELAKYLLKEINQELADQPGFRSKKISPAGINIIKDSSWPGNVRELRATLLRACIWAKGDTIDAKQLKQVMLEAPSNQVSTFTHSLDSSFDIHDVMGDIPRHYVPIALSDSGGNKTKAANLLGLKSQQVLTKWIEKYRIDI